MSKNYWQGKVIRLRGIESADAAHFIRWNLDSERARHLDFLWPPVSDASVQAWVEERSRQRLENDSFHWVIENLVGEPVGTISTQNCDHRNGTFGYGIDIAPEHQRKGYAREAIGLVLHYYFDELRYQKVTVPVHADNLPSIKLHEGLGFRREGILRRMMYTNGHFIDMLWYGLTDDEFRKKFRP